MLSYWAEVLVRASITTWVDVTQLDSFASVARAFGPFITIAITYWLIWGKREMVSEHFGKPFKAGLIGTAIWLVCWWLFNMAQVPSLMQEETDAAAFARLEEHRKRTLASRDVVLPGEASTAANSLNSIEAAELVSLRRRVPDLERQIGELQGQLDDRSKRQGLIDKLTKTHEEVARLTGQCRIIPLEELKGQGEKLLSEAAGALVSAGRKDDAQRLLDGVPPLGMPRLVRPNCDPLEKNVGATFDLIVRRFILSDIIRSLDR